ncbi:SDR family oxidoreductase [Opitutus sp. GAS368]|uniref:SDR family oxidoreductase n=1 Tax=Opitutus sp. GAS368 TaxID=1882749 RepID=UPI00087BBA92|nr:SDR family oxidoreductase [Opitutus sp. GAS368]SDR85496.1 NAD(P)-dependent dehydrogenase, short-chain alcohol dehydrogenase family [Opitutus sp. GAS368]
MPIPPTRTPILQRFHDKVALVTGGTNGIGHAIALELLREGAQVVATGLPADLAEGRAAFAAAGFTPLLLAGDMADEAFCRQLVAAALERHGRIDCLVNNAFSFVAKGLEATREDFLRSFTVGPFAFAQLTQLVAGPMQRQGGGAIVNVSSISAWIAQPNRWTYNTAKGAVAQLTRCAALDLAPHRIRVNSVSPGWIWTREVDKAAGGDRTTYDPVWGQFHMLGRLGHPVEIAGPVLFLLSDDASFITGTDLPVDGGYNGLGPEGLGQNTRIAGSR